VLAVVVLFSTVLTLASHDGLPTTAVGAGTIVGVVAVSPAPAPGPTPTLLSSIGGRGKVVALTFDDGPTTRYTPQVLDVLARYRVPATFCEVGQLAQAQPALVRRVVAAGHRLCDHTTSHDTRLATRPAGVIDQQLRTSREILRIASGGADVACFRAPAGRWSPTLERLSAQDGMQSLGWTIDTRDWTRPGTPAIVDAVERHVRPGAIILLHDGGGPRDQTIAAVSQLIPWLRAQGYSIVLPG